MLYQQVREKIEARATELEQRIHEIHANLLKVTKIQQLEDEQQATELYKKYDAIKTLPEEIGPRLTIETIGKIEDFEIPCQQFEAKISQASELKTALEGLVRPLPVEAEEQQLLNRIVSRQPTDLTEILVDLLDAEEADTTDLLHRLENLYRKNRVKITITRLG